VNARTGSPAKDVQRLPGGLQSLTAPQPIACALQKQPGKSCDQFEEFPTRRHQSVQQGLPEK